jgi:hypothetical protein
MSHRCLWTAGPAHLSDASGEAGPPGGPVDKGGPGRIQWVRSVMVGDRVMHEGNVTHGRWLGNP